MTVGRSRLVALIVAGTSFMEFLDGTVIATALPAMAHDFGVAPVSLSINILYISIESTVVFRPQIHITGHGGL